MAWYRAGGGGIPSSLKTDMNDVLNKKFGTSVDYPPADWAPTVNLMGPLPEKTASGAIVTFADGADTVPLKKCEITLPASLDGYSEVDVVAIGKNLLPMVNYDGGVYNPDIGRQLNLTVSETQFTQNGNVYSVNTSVSWKTFTVLFPIISGATYYEKWTLSVESGQQGSTRAYLDEDFKVLARYNSNSSAPIVTNGVMTPPTGAKYLAISWTNRGTAVQTLNITEPMIEIGSSASDYEPYTAPTTHTADLGRTIHGGTADVVNGQGTSSYDKGSMSSTYLSGLNSDYIGYEASTAYFGGHPSVWVRNWNYSRAKARQSGGIGCVCNYFPISMHNTTIFSAQYRIYFDVNGKNISSVADFIAFVQNLEANNESLDIVYELNDTYTTDFTFDPVPIDSKLGNNTIWSEQGSAEVTYRADINLALGGQ